MTLPLLVDAGTAAEWGFDLTDVALRRASTRIRGHLRQQVSAGVSTITARGPVFRLPERPVVSVESVVDADGATVGFALEGSILRVDSLDLVTVSYTHGHAVLPEPLVELVCQVASRLSAPTNDLVSQGVQQHSAGSFSISYGFDSYKAQSGLTQGEKDTLARYWPPLPQIIVAGV